MKALMKGNAAKYFEKKEKAVEDPEVVMNGIEARAISKVIGIAEFQIPNFSSFFEQVAKIRLPHGFDRYMNPEKTKVIYINLATNEETELHPNIENIKVVFYELIRNSKAVHHFEIKSNKLLPFVEEKLMRQCMGLSSKRRDAEKNNSGRDEDGNIVISKLGRVKPEMRSLISSRSYMLKALVEKIYTKRELWGRGKRANAYANILASYKQNKNQITDQDEEEETIESLQKYEEIFEENCGFYLKNYGNVLCIPEEIMNSRAYFRSTPDSTLRNINLLNIDKDELQLFWLARMMEALPLPPLWKIKRGDSFDQYYYEPLKIVFDLHPSYIYIIQQMNLFKGLFSEMDLVQQNYYTNMREMVFFDFFDRPYEVDLYGLIVKDHEGPITKKKAIKKSYELGHNDWMAVQAIHNTQLPVQEYILIEKFLKYWGSLDYREEIYLPAISPFGEVTWSSAINQKALQFCPHAATLRIIHEQELIDLPMIKDTDLKDSKDDKQNEELIFAVFPEERETFLRYFIRNDPKPLSQAYQVPEGCDDQTFYDQIFISNFDLESELKFQENEPTPLWLEKVHAKRNSSLEKAKLDWSTSSFEEVKNRFSHYAIETTQKHEPEREEEVLKIIEEVKDKEGLKNLINHINDIDAREERKRLANIGMVEEKEDTFGSSLSQIDMDEEEDEGEEEESVDLNQDVEDDSDEGEEDDKSETESIKIAEVEEKKEEVIEESSQEEQQPPEQYVSVIYEKDEAVEEMKEHQLDARLKELLREKKLKHKYSESSIRMRYQQSNEFAQKSTEAKRNLLISNLHTEKAPYRTNPVIHSIPSRALRTASNLPDLSEDFIAFRSEASDYENSRVQEEIERWRELNLQKEESVSSDGEFKKVVDETKETIQLQPIYRIKPDIDEDPVLRHVSQFGDLSKFRHAFQSKQKQGESEKKNRLSINSKINPEDSSRKDIDSSIKRKLSFLQKPDSSGTGLQKFNSVLSLSNRSMSPTKIESKFNRVCLGSTASSLLTSEAVTRRGDLVLLEARKSLVSKGRGLETLISRNY